VTVQAVAGFSLSVSPLLFVCCVSGRRTRDMVKQILQSKGEWFDNSHVVIAGLSNSYSSYITTYEEYQQQRYEGASTLYGPHTLAAHMQNIAGLVNAIVAGESVPVGPIPIDMRNRTFCFMPGVVEDSTPAGVEFGDVVTDVEPSYTVGETVEVVFQGASPRNDLMLESSYLFVDQLQSDGSWTTVAVDGDFETRFLWTRIGVDQSQCTVQWVLTTENAPAGTYRIRHQGVWKSLPGTLTPYNGTSSIFTIGQ
jgi:neutral ceramidase